MIAIICTGPTGATFINWSINVLSGNKVYWNEKKELKSVLADPLQGHTCHEHWPPDRTCFEFNPSDFHPETILNIHTDFEKDPNGKYLVDTVKSLWGQGIKSVWIDDTGSIAPECNIRKGDRMPDTNEAVLRAFKWWSTTRQILSQIQKFASATISPTQFTEQGIVKMMQDINIDIDQSAWATWRPIYQQWWQLNEQELTWRFRLSNYQSGELTGVQERWRSFYQNRLTK